jgi:hypothetical protein
MVFEGQLPAIFKGSNIIYEDTSTLLLRAATDVHTEVHFCTSRSNGKPPFCASAGNSIITTSDNLESTSAYADSE